MSVVILRWGVGYPGAINPRVHELVFRQIQIARYDDRILVPVEHHVVHVVGPCGEEGKKRKIRLRSFTRVACISLSTTNETTNDSLQLSKTSGHSCTSNGNFSSRSPQLRVASNLKRRANGSYLSPIILVGVILWA